MILKYGGGDLQLRLALEWRGMHNAVASGRDLDDRFSAALDPFFRCRPVRADDALVPAVTRAPVHPFDPPVQRIDQAILDEEKNIRGGNVRYWEEVQEGEQLGERAHVDARFNGAP